MLTHLRAATALLLAFTVITGIVYPLVITALAQIMSRSAANGSMIVRGGVPVGSALIGQNFTSDHYFHGRPSAAGEKGYDASASSGSNLGPLSKKLIERVEMDVVALRKAGPTTIPADAVKTSASGLDPHISPSYAELQIVRIAKARNVDQSVVRTILQRQIEGSTLGIIGEPRVNVLLLNLALDAALPKGTG